MLKNYIVTALRSFAKNRVLTFVNITGLAVGIACALLVFLFIQYELSVDGFHRKIDRLYCLAIVGESRGDDRSMDYRLDVKEQVVPQLLKNYPGIANVARLMVWPGKIEYRNEQIRENRFWFTDPEVFGVLTLSLRNGDRDSALRTPGSVVLTPDMAVKYFGDQDPIGRTLKAHMCRYPVSYTLTVTGILEPLPPATSFKIDFLAHFPFSRLNRDRKRSWRDIVVDAWAITIVEIPDVSDLQRLDKALNARECIDRYKKLSLKNMRYQFIPLKNIYMKSDATFFEANAEPGFQYHALRKGDMRLLLFLTGLGITILMVSCMDIINYTTSRATLRASEIGVRKAVGARRTQLMIQFVTETILLSYLALPIAIGLAELMLPYFNTLVNRELSVSYATNWVHLLGTLGIATLTGFLAGTYPAFALSAFNPSSVLRRLHLKTSAFVRKCVLVVQLVVCITVILFSLVMFEEFKAPRLDTIGFNADNLIFFVVDDINLSKRYPYFRRAILSNPEISHVTSSSFVPWQYGFIPSHAYTYGESAVRAKTISADTDFPATFQIKIVGGEDFKNDSVHMEGKILINETARKVLRSEGTGLLYKNICMPNGWCNRVRGIMQDFNCFYPSQRIGPLAILPSKLFRPVRNHITIRLPENNQQEAIEMIEKTVKRFFPRSPFEYRYISQELMRLHARKTGYRLNALLFITGCSLFIAFIGLLGFSAYETERCTKEIGIRKALGAGPVQIVVHFVIRFLKLTLIANVVAWPICHFAIQHMLKAMTYPRSVPIGFADFFFAGLSTVVLTILAVSVQAFRAAITEPIKALRYE